jgi:hypothetical protein
VQVAPPGVAITMYSVISAPLGVVGAVQDTEADPSPGRATTSVGSLGGPTGVAETGALLRSPPAVRAVTTNEYSVPLSSPETQHVVVSFRTAHRRAGRSPCSW